MRAAALRACVLLDPGRLPTRDALGVEGIAPVHGRDDLRQGPALRVGLRVRSGSHGHDVRMSGRLCNRLLDGADNTISSHVVTLPSGSGWIDFVYSPDSAAWVRAVERFIGQAWVTVCDPWAGSDRARSCPCPESCHPYRG